MPNVNYYVKNQIVIFPSSNATNKGKITSEENLTEIVRRICKENFVVNTGDFAITHSGSSVTIAVGTANIQGYCIQTSDALDIGLPESAGTYIIGIKISKDVDNHILYTKAETGDAYEYIKGAIFGYFTYEDETILKLATAVYDGTNITITDSDYRYAGINAKDIFATTVGGTPTRYKFYDESTDKVNTISKKSDSLTTARSLWGQSFDGTGNVTGDLSSTGSITPATTGASDVGSSTKEFRSVYGATLYESKVALSSKYTTLATDQTISGSKTFSGTTGFSGIINASNVSNFTGQTNYVNTQVNVTGSNMSFASTSYLKFVGSLSLSGEGNGSLGNVTFTGINSGKVSVTDTTQSTSSSTGSITSLGGVGVSGNIYSGGSGNFTNGVYVGGNIASTSTSTGSLVVLGGAGISGALYSQSVNSNSATIGTVSVSSTAVSSSINTGALVVAGGVGVGGNLYSSNSYTTGTSRSSSAIVYGGTQSTSTTTGALTVTGGVGVSGNLYAARVYNAVYNDIAELFEKAYADEVLEPGDVIQLDISTGKYRRCSSDYCPYVVGVYSDSYGYLLGGDKDASLEENLKKYIPIGLSGRVRVKTDDKDILPGDILYSGEEGKAIISQGFYRAGRAIGKALEEPRDGKVLMMIMLG